MAESHQRPMLGNVEEKKLYRLVKKSWFWFFLRKKYIIYLFFCFSLAGSSGSRLTGVRRIPSPVPPPWSGGSGTRCRSSLAWSSANPASFSSPSWASSAMAASTAGSARFGAGCCHRARFPPSQGLHRCRGQSWAVTLFTPTAFLMNFTALWGIMTFPKGIMTSPKGTMAIQEQSYFGHTFHWVTAISLDDCKEKLHLLEGEVS